jgi:hypothetical protein
MDAKEVTLTFNRVDLVPENNESTAHLPESSNVVTSMSMTPNNPIASHLA